MIQDVNPRVEAVRSTLKPLLERPVSDYVRRDVLGTDLSFERGENFFRQMLIFLQRLNACRLEDVPDPTLQDIQNKLNDFIKNIQLILTFTAGGVLPNTQPTQQRDTMLSNAITGFNELYRASAPFVALNDPSLATLGTDLSVARNLIGDLTAERENALSEAKTVQVQISDILSSAQEAAGKVGVTQNAAFFAKEVAMNSRAATWWLIITAILAAVTLLFALGFLLPFKTPAGTQTADIWQPIISRLVALSVLYYGLVWSSRNYFALQHNVIINRHRQNALSTFQTFVEAATDDAVKNHVLLKATESIFAQEVSGYLTREPDPRPSSQILEVLGSTMHRG